MTRGRVQVAGRPAECSECGDPVRRSTWEANAGRCTDCRLRLEHSAPAQLQLLPDPEAE